MALLLTGCGTTRVTDTTRTATEQLVVSDAVDQAVSRLDFRMLAGKPVFFDPQYLDGTVDKGYVVSTIRQQLLASGCLLLEDRAKATYVVEARAGGVGTDRNSVLVGVPQMAVPTLVPGQMFQIPEIPLAKKTDQKGVAKLAVFAYNRVSGRPVYQSGVVQASSVAKDTWLLGAGPFQGGTIRDGMEFAGEEIAIPLLHDKEETKDAQRLVSVTEQAAWAEPQPSKAQIQSAIQLARLLQGPASLSGPAIVLASGSSAFAPTSLETLVPLDNQNLLRPPTSPRPATASGN